jgi:hypothetical protein
MDGELPQEFVWAALGFFDQLLVDGRCMPLNLNLDAVEAKVILDMIFDVFGSGIGPQLLTCASYQ